MFDGSRNVTRKVGVPFPFRQSIRAFTELTRPVEKQMKTLERVSAMLFPKVKTNKNTNIADLLELDSRHFKMGQNMGQMFHSYKMYYRKGTPAIKKKS